ncbi:MAG: lysophospholipid acyltransferase family protein [Ginsengibacter sp.]
MYYLVYGIFYVISLLPIRVLYLLSDAVYGLFYYIIRYRRDVVMNNLTIAFPGKTIAEKEKIAKKFYHNFIDSFIETIKMISASDAYILKRFTGNWEVINDLLKSGTNCHILLGHTFNWEWGNLSIGLNMEYNLLVVYMPISNKIFDRLFLKLRTRGKTRMLSAHNMRKDLMPYRNTQYALGLAADQNPGNPSYAYWLNFFNKAAPFVTGPEKGARSRNLPVIFCYIEKLKRGYYNMVFSIGETNPSSLPEGALTIKFVHYLENIIRMHPDMWLWSHNRWKHKWKEEYSRLWIDKEEPKV